MLLAVPISSYGCTWEVWRALKKLELLSAAPRATLTPLSCSPNFPRASITRYTHAKHEPILKFLEQIARSWRHISALLHVRVVGSRVYVVTLHDQMVSMVRVARFSCGFSQRWQGIRQRQRTRVILCTFMLWINRKGEFSGSKIALISRFEWIMSARGCTRKLF